jgi:hypothetical protein
MPTSLSEQKDERWPNTLGFFGDYRGFYFEEPFAFWPGLVIDTDYSMKVLYGSDMDSGNKTGLLLDALDVLDAFQQPQGLVGYSLRRVRQVRRIDLQFIAPRIPPLQTTTTIIVARKIFQIFYIARLR